MGQHKFNPNVQAANNGELPPKKKKMSKRETERWLRKAVEDKVYNQIFLPNLPIYY